MPGRSRRVSLRSARPTRLQLSTRVETAWAYILALIVTVSSLF